MQWHGQYVAATERKTQAEVAERIRSTRLRLELSQAKVAERTGIDLKRYQRLEGAHVNPTVRTLFRVAKAMGVDTWEMLRAPDSVD